MTCAGVARHDGPTRRLRVLQISHDYKGPFRAVCHQYAEAFSDHEVTTVYVCGCHDADVIARTGGDEVLFFERTARSVRGMKLGTLFRFARLFRKRSFDVVIAHRYKPIYFAGVMSLFFSIPVVLAVAHEHQVFKRRTRRLLIALCRKIICVGVSASVSRDIERDCGPLGQQGRLYTLPLAIDVDKAASLLARDEARRRLGVPFGAFCFGTVGRLVAKKDHEVLLAAFGEFLRSGSHAESVLLIIGSGPEEQRLRNYAAQHGMESHLVFAGHVDDAYRYMKALDVFVFPSGAAEAFGIVLLEAMLASVPIISSDAPGPAEVVGGSGMLFKVGDAVDLAEKLAQSRHMAAGDLAGLATAGHERLQREYTLEAFRRRVFAVADIRRLALERN